VEYSDMLMADEVEWPGQEVEMLFGDSHWFENSDWDKDPSPPPLVWQSDTPLLELPAWLWRKQHQTQQESHVTSRDMCRSAGDACNRSRREACGCGRRLGWTVGFSDFHDLMRFTSKKMPNNILKNVC
jgi:hypothetical protein